MNIDGFPGGSKTRVNQAGEKIRTGNFTLDDLLVIEEWRAAHRAVLNTFQASLRTRTSKRKAKGIEIVVAQRHKRRNTIFNKLLRLPRMELARMDDIAGCRLIFRSIQDLHDFRSDFHKARFKHKRRNDIDKYDYIKSPKKTGYRGIHDVYFYDVNSDVGRNFKGLQLEIQYRTLVQHAWATAVEVIGFITESQPKFQQGDNRYEFCMALASEVLARAYESSNGPFPDKDNDILISEFDHMDNELGLIRTLSGLNSVEAEATSNKNSILIFKPDGSLEVKSFSEATVALRELFRLEKEFPGMDIVLVKADTNEEIRMAFKNYFSDAKDFVRLITEARDILLAAR